MAARPHPRMDRRMTRASMGQDDEIESDRGRAGEERYRNLVEHAFDIIVECAVSGRILYVAPNIQDVLGFAPSEVVGSFINELVHPDDIRKGIDAFSNAVLKNEQIETALRYRHKNGGWRTIEGRGKAYTASYGKVRVAIIGRDITARVAAD